MTGIFEQGHILFYSYQRSFYYHGYFICIMKRLSSSLRHAGTGIVQAARH